MLVRLSFRVVVGVFANQQDGICDCAAHENKQNKKLSLLIGIVLFDQFFSPELPLSAFCAPCPPLPPDHD